MNGKESELFSHLLETFKVEAREHVSAISAGLMELENSPAAERDVAALEVVYRSAHSLKGGARIVNLSLVEFLCQSLEECLAAVRRGERALTPPLLDLLHETAGVIEKILLSPSPEAPPTALKSAAIKIRRQLDDAASSGNSGVDTGKAEGSRATAAEKPPEAVPPVEPPVPSAPVATATHATPEPMDDVSAPSGQPPSSSPRAMAAETVRVPALRLDGLMLKAEELIVCKLAMQEHASGVKELAEHLTLYRMAFSGIDALDRDGIREMDRTLATLVNRLTGLRRNMEDDNRQMSSMVENLIDDAKTLLMFPFSSVTQGFARLVRELAREQDKDIDLRLAGEEIELDRRILQELKDPLVHLLRNCIDHGVESRAERRSAGKPARARIAVSATCIDNGKVEIIIRDDGRGIEIAALRAAAVRLGVVTPEAAEAMGDDEIRRFIFRSGFSTRDEVTTISGRGLGLAIAAERVEKLGGNIFVDSAPGKGTCFRLVIPLSLATFRGIQVRVGQRLFAIPTLNVLKVCRVRQHELKTVGNQESLAVEQQTIPVVALAAILGLPADPVDPAGFQTLMLLGAGKEQAGFRVDEVIGEEDLLVKGLGPQLVRVPNISGATVLGNGAVAPVLNSIDLLRSAFGGHAHRHVSPSEGAMAKAARTARRILVVDDSITSRTLLKNVLESYGYDVTTAIDGIEALSALREANFDLVSSDVEMPRMDGFELTARIRSDERFSRLPVVLVTSMDSPEDRKKGINAGADAYIVKSSFDQTGLLDTIRKLI